MDQASTVREDLVGTMRDKFKEEEGTLLCCRQRAILKMTCPELLACAD